MRLLEIERARIAAVEFIVRCDSLIELKIAKKYNWETPKQNGALRRQSLELTRALAEMRRP
jgi:hypothetical protein